jgi:hypothetical protein
VHPSQEGQGNSQECERHEISRTSRSLLNPATATAAALREGCDIEVGIAGISDSIAILVELIDIGHDFTIIRFIRDTVAVKIPFTDIPFSVAVTISLDVTGGDPRRVRAVGDERTVVPVSVERSADRVPTGIRHRPATVAHPIVVTVGIERSAGGEEWASHLLTVGASVVIGIRIVRIGPEGVFLNGSRESIVVRIIADRTAA